MGNNMENNQNYNVNIFMSLFFLVVGLFLISPFDISLEKFITESNKLYTLGGIRLMISSISFIVIGIIFYFYNKKDMAELFIAFSLLFSFSPFVVSFISCLPDNIGLIGLIGFFILFSSLGLLSGVSLNISLYIFKKSYDKEIKKIINKN